MSTERADPARERPEAKHRTDEGPSAQVASSLVALSRKPAMTTRYIRLRELLTIVPVSPMTVFRWERKGQFPKRTRLGPNVVVWELNVVLDWCATRDRSAERDARQAGDRAHPAAPQHASAGDRQ